MSRISLGKVFAVAMAVAVVAACTNNPTASDPAASAGPGKAQPGTYGLAKFSLQVGKVGALSKSSSIGMKKLILTAVAGGDKPDTVRDTSAISGNEQQTVNRTLKLKPRSSWVLFAKTLDLKDSIVHQGSTQAFSVKVSDTSKVTLILQSRFTMYQATFANLPQSIGVDQDNKGDKVGVAVTRLVLRVDGVIKADSTAKEYFSGLQTIVLNFDYVYVGMHDITLEAYGRTGTYNGLLYTGTNPINTVPGEDGSRQIVMAWAGPSTGAANASIIVGHVGKIDVTPKFPENL